MYLASYLVFVFTYFGVTCCKNLRRKYPINILVMTIFTLSLSIWAASVSVFHDAIWVMTAVGITAALCLGLTLFAMQTKYDFTGEKEMYVINNIMPKFISFQVLVSISLQQCGCFSSLV